MKNLIKLLGIFALVAVIGFSMAGCENPAGSDGDKVLTGTVSISPSGTVTVNTKLTATYSGTEIVTYQWYKNNTAISGETSAMYTPTAAGSYTVTVSRAGYNSKTSLAVTVNALSSNDITYTVARADGADGTADTTGIVFTFSASVTGLTADHISVTSGNGSVTKGALSGSGASWTLGVTVITAGNVTVAIDKSGIEAETKDVTVFKEGQTAPTLNSITAVYNGTTAIYPNTPVDSLKADLTVTATYSTGAPQQVTAYSLSGTLTVGTSTITVNYKGKETTFNVTVTAIPTGGDGTPGLAYELITSGANANTYRVRKGTVTGGAVVIPETYNGLPVTEIGSVDDDWQIAAFYNTSITSVAIPAGVTTIGSSAFSNCPNLSITIPEGVTSIGSSAFYYCTSLTSITIPEGVTSIGNYAFSGCTNLKNIVIDNDKLTFTLDRTLLHIFELSDSSVTFKKNVPDYAFDGTNNTAGARLTSVTILEGVTSIGQRAFAGCPNLASVTIGAGVTTIGDSAFSRTGLTEITIPASVTSIGDYAFGSCTGLTGITVDENNPNYASQDGVLYNKAKTEIVQVPQAISGHVTIPESVTEINGAFYNCTGLTGITIPESVTSIGNNAFYGCTGLTGITIPESVTSIGGYAFQNCTGLTSVTIGEGVTSIGYEAFRNCTGLTSITIPEGVTSIGYYAFADCTNLKNVIIDTDKLTFTYNSYLPDRFPIDNLSVTFKKNVPNSAFYSSSYNSTVLTSVTLLEGVTSIGYEAFNGCTSLASVTIPEGVTSIGSSAFYGCTSLTSITIPEGVTSIGNYAFYDWTDAQTIYVNGYANEAAADTAWGSGWRYQCNAVIVYGIATEIVQLNRTVFITGEQLGSIAATIRYSNNTTETVAIPAADITGFDSTTTGTKTLTVTYRGLTATFTVTVVDEMLITNTTEWNNAITQFNGANGSVTLTIGGSFNVAGSTTPTFGITTSGTLTVTLKGSGTLSLSSNGNILNIGANQTVIIDSENLILQGRSDNYTSLVVIGTTAQLELKNGTITGNSRNNSYYIAEGGGVYVYGTFTMNGGTISNNTLRNEDGAPEAYGGGVYVDGSGNFTMNGGTISGNSVITRTTDSRYQSRAYGGGVCVYGSGIFTMNGGTISGNSASASGSTSLNRAEGGGVNVYGSSSTFRITNGTIYGNTETTTSLRNTISAYNGSSSGAALYVRSGATAQRGTFSIPGDITSTWNGINLSESDNTINVLNGALQ